MNKCRNCRWAYQVTLKKWICVIADNWFNDEDADRPNACKFWRNENVVSNYIAVDRSVKKNDKSLPNEE